MKDGIAKSLLQSQPSREDRQQAEGADSFDTEGCNDQKLHEFHNRTELRCGDGVLDGQPGQQTDLRSRQRENSSRHCDNPQSTDLYQQQDDDPAEYSPLCRCIKDYKTRHTCCGGGCKQRIQKRDLFASDRCPGQAQKDCACQNH